MGEALRLASQAAADGEIPVGAVVVKDGEIIGRGFNRREEAHDAVAHAECVAISDACASIGDWRLTDCTIYVTLEPCPMCAGAILGSRISRVVFGKREPETGACVSKINLFEMGLGPRPSMKEGVLAERSAELLTSFFEDRRGCSSKPE